MAALGIIIILFLSLIITPDVGNNCNDSWRFSWDKIKSLEKQLEANWPDLKYNSRSLWQHEWRRHGTCATTLKTTNNEFRYFHKVLRLNRLDAFNPQMALEKAGITPSCKKAYLVSSLVTTGRSVSIIMTMCTPC
ncbi:ribonuclease Oy-like [Haliotis asinina]|uniref:ribonuclease Oy-like n=1 Tax=Haliotis asinina TaxID=109174 RepID=UPI003531E70F